MVYIRKTRSSMYRKLVIYGLSAAAVLLLLVFVLNYRIAHTVHSAEINSMMPAEQNKQNVVRATRAIKAGEMADTAKFEVVALSKDLVPVGAVTSMQQLKNKRVASNLAEKEFLLQSDLVDSTEWYEEGDRLIEHTFTEGAVPLKVDAGSIVDIKLFRPDGQDSVVIAKTTVVERRGNTLSFYLNEEEQEYIKQANTEGLLFLVQYLDKSQPASITNYVPSYAAASSNFADSSKRKE